LIELDLEQLIDLFGLCREADILSIAVLNDYMDQTQGSDWREEATGEGAAAPGTGAAMTRDEALSILGLTEGAGEEEIRDAHRRLMQKLHPDRGGSDYLAAKINEAKRLLLAD
jgi:DnaJ-class molecular chaperone